MSQVLYAEKSGYHVLKFVGDVRLSLGPAISGFLSRLRELEDCRGMVVDLSETEAIDSTALGLIAKLGICTNFLWPNSNLHSFYDKKLKFGRRKFVQIDSFPLCLTFNGMHLYPQA